jgi:hypothetical protein
LLFFGVHLIFRVADGLAALAWLDVLGKTIPTERRGRLMGLAQLFAGLLAIGAGVLIARLLGEEGLPFPQGHAVILG